MIDAAELLRWRYYFLDLPGWACGICSAPSWRNLSVLFESEISSIRDGLAALWDSCGKTAGEDEIETALERAIWIKLLRESDGYHALGMTKNRLHRYFIVEGLENLRPAAESGRPTLLLTGHVGSYVVPLIALSHLGFRVYPVAATVSHPFSSVRHFSSLYHAIVKRRLQTPYIYTDLRGRIDRSIITALDSKAVLWVAPDLPRSMSPLARMPVSLLGCNSSLPSGLIKWALKKNPLFLTAWNTIETDDNIHFRRRLRIDPPIDQGLDAQGILQTYADRLSKLLCREPWQWMQLNIFREFMEGAKKEADGTLDK
jgi:lauroyl/myristoyl acyltransferase